MAGPRTVSYGFIKLLNERKDSQFVEELQKYLIMPTEEDSLEIPVLPVFTEDFILESEVTGAILLIDLPEPGNIIIPANLNIPIGYPITLIWYGIGQPAIVSAPGVMIRSIANRYRISDRYGEVRLKRIGANEWHLSGELSVEVPLTTEEGDPLLTEDGQTLIFDQG